MHQEKSVFTQFCSTPTYVFKAQCPNAAHNKHNHTVNVTIERQQRTLQYLVNEDDQQQLIDLKKYINYNIIIMGNFNTALSLLDRSIKQKLFKNILDLEEEIEDRLSKHV